MPSRNNINKPAGKVKRSHFAKGIVKKAPRVKAASRTSLGRYNKDTAPRPTDPKSLALYTGPVSDGAVLTTQTLSKKRQKKLERNSRYIAQRNAQLTVDLAAKNEGMDIDMAPVEKREKPQKPQSNLDKVKQALWTAVEDYKSGAMAVESSGEGTTLGVQAF